MKTLAAAAVALLLSGCASIPVPQVHVIHKKPAMVVQKPVVVPLSPEQPATFKQRWFDHFKKHPKWFH